MGDFIDSCFKPTNLQLFIHKKLASTGYEILSQDYTKDWFLSTNFNTDFIIQRAPFSTHLSAIIWIRWKNIWIWNAAISQLKMAKYQMITR